MKRHFAVLLPLALFRLTATGQSRIADLPKS